MSLAIDVDIIEKVLLSDASWGTPGAPRGPSDC